MNDVDEMDRLGRLEDDADGVTQAIGALVRVVAPEGAVPDQQGTDLADEVVHQRVRPPSARSTTTCHRLGRR